MGLAGDHVVAGVSRPVHSNSIERALRRRIGGAPGRGAGARRLVRHPDQHTGGRKWRSLPALGCTRLRALLGRAYPGGCLGDTRGTGRAGRSGCHMVSAGPGRTQFLRSGIVHRIETLLVEQAARTPVGHIRNWAVPGMDQSAVNRTALGVTFSCRASSGGFPGESSAHDVDVARQITASENPSHSTWSTQVSTTRPTDFTATGQCVASGVSRALWLRQEDRTCLRGRRRLQSRTDHRAERTPGRAAVADHPRLRGEHHAPPAAVS